MNDFFKVSLKQLILSSRLWHLSEKLHRSGVAILRYHSALENPSEYASSIGCGIIHKAECFARQMQFLAKNYNPVTMDQILSFVEGREVLPRRSIAVTFDDGYADNAEVAAPIMEQYGIFGTFYVTTGAVSPGPIPWFVRLRNVFGTSPCLEWKNPVDGLTYQLADKDQNREAYIQACSQCACLCGNEQIQLIESIESDLKVTLPAKHNKFMLSPEQIKLLHARGHIIGSHTVSHPNVAYIDEKKVYEELFESKKYLEGVLGAPVVHFSYPSPIFEPHWRDSTVDICHKIGYRTAVTCTSGLVFSGDNPLSLRRLAVPKKMFPLRWNIETVFAGLAPR